jgi:hypothetical protein
MLSIIAFIPSFLCFSSYFIKMFSFESISFHLLIVTSSVRTGTLKHTSTPFLYTFYYEERLFFFPLIFYKKIYCNKKKSLTMRLFPKITDLELMCLPCKNRS